MQRTYPNTPGHMATAVSASLLVQLQLSEQGIICFEWPQSMDSGIDLVAFATYAEVAATRLSATAFTAAVQVKGTETAFSDGDQRRVYIQKHRDYWQTATMPVFVICASKTTQVVLVEDAWSMLVTQRHLEGSDLKAIVASTSVAAAAEHLRLRMMVHALSPSLSQRLRSRRLAELKVSAEARLESVWTALAQCGGPYNTFAAPRSWSEAQQTFEVLSHMLRDARMRREFSNNVARIRDSYRAAGVGSTSDPIDLLDDIGVKEIGAPTVLAGAVEVLWKLASFQDDSQLGTFTGQPLVGDGDASLLEQEARSRPHRSYQRLVAESAIDVIGDMWQLTVKELCGDDVAEFLHRSAKGILSRTRYAITDLSRANDGDFITELRRAFRELDPKFETRHWT